MGYIIIRCCTNKPCVFVIPIPSILRNREGHLSSKNKLSEEQILCYFKSQQILDILLGNNLPSLNCIDLPFMLFLELGVSPQQVQ